MSEIQTTNCVFWILVLSSLNIVWSLKKLCSMICCESDVYSREIINMFLVDQVSGLVEKSNIEIYSVMSIVFN